MLKKINQQLASISSDDTTLISAGTEVVGDLIFSGNLEILGSVVGNISSDEQGSRVRLLQGGSVKGDIRCSVVEVNGVAKGNIFARDQLCLESQCEVEGNVHYVSVTMQSGAQVRGYFNHHQLQQDGRLPAEGKAAVTANVQAIDSNKQRVDQK
jgi:cytoskeletal protein CcmA (bactofilin family)